MKIEPSGVIFTALCDIQTERCRAKQPAPVTAVWAIPGRWQINVCRPCLEEQVRAGEWEIQGARIARRADVAVYSPGRKLQLVVEVKNSAYAERPPQNWAQQIHRNLHAHSGLPPAAYFLLALLPGNFYLWKEGGSHNFDRPADFEADADQLLQPYFDRLSVPPENASGYDLEVIVSTWLKDLLEKEPPSDEAHQWLLESGLYAALKGGSVEMQAPLAA